MDTKLGSKFPTGKENRAPPASRLARVAPRLAVSSTFHRAAGQTSPCTSEISVGPRRRAVVTRFPRDVEFTRDARYVRVNYPLNSRNAKALDVASLQITPQRATLYPLFTSAVSICAHSLGYAFSQADKNSYANAAAIADARLSRWRDAKMSILSTSPPPFSARRVTSRRIARHRTASHRARPVEIRFTSVLINGSYICMIRP